MFYSFLDILKFSYIFDYKLSFCCKDKNSIVPTTLKRDYLKNAKKCLIFMQFRNIKYCIDLNLKCVDLNLLEDHLLAWRNGFKYSWQSHIKFDQYTYFHIVDGVYECLQMASGGLGSGDLATNIFVLVSLVNSRGTVYHACV